MHACTGFAVMYVHWVLIYNCWNYHLPLLSSKILILTCNYMISNSLNWTRSLISNVTQFVYFLLCFKICVVNVFTLFQVLEFDINPAFPNNWHCDIEPPFRHCSKNLFLHFFFGQSTIIYLQQTLLQNVPFNFLRYWVWNSRELMLFHHISLFDVVPIAALIIIVFIPVVYVVQVDIIRQDNPIIHPSELRNVFCK
jgi:hypothetical protein